MQHAVNDLSTYEDLPAYALVRDIFDCFGFSPIEVLTDTAALKAQRLRYGKRMGEDMENGLIPDYAAIIRKATLDSLLDEGLTEEAMKKKF